MTKFLLLAAILAFINVTNANRQTSRRLLSEEEEDENCRDWCYTATERTWKKKCKWNRCINCVECETSSPTSQPTSSLTTEPTQRPTTDPTSSPEDPTDHCLDWCYTETEKTWKKKCKWNRCNECVECGTSSPTPSPTAEPVCEDDLEFTNARGMDCSSIVTHLIARGVTCMHAPLHESCCHSCRLADAAQPTGEEFFDDVVCPMGYAYHPDATYMDSTAGAMIPCNEANRACNLNDCPEDELHSFMITTDCCTQRRDILDLMAQKQGMNSNGKVTKEILDRFTDSASWYWTYGLSPTPGSEEWGKAHGKEFVPLINLKEVLPEEYGSCHFRDGTCTPEMLIQVLTDVINRGVQINYLMGYNEPYASHQEASSYANKGDKGVSGTEGAEWWRLYIQPVAEALNLDLVSPTTGISKQKSGWLIEFLSACYENKDDEEKPCNVELIKAISVHEYKCYGSYWRKFAAVDGGADVVLGDDTCEENFRPRSETNMYTQFREAMAERYPDDMDFWNNYFDNVQIWVTETSCSGDLKYDKVTNIRQTPTASQSCERITGNSCQHEEGSIAAILGMDNITRYSWFTLLPNPPTKHPNYNSITAAGILAWPSTDAKPVGRALLTGLDEATRCDSLFQDQDLN